MGYRGRTPCPGHVEQWTRRAFARHPPNSTLRGAICVIEIRKGSIPKCLWGKAAFYAGVASNVGIASDARSRHSPAHSIQTQLGSRLFWTAGAKLVGKLMGTPPENFDQLQDGRRKRTTRFGNDHNL